MQTFLLSAARDEAVRVVHVATNEFTLSWTDRIDVRYLHTTPRAVRDRQQSAGKGSPEASIARILFTI